MSIDYDNTINYLKSTESLINNPDISSIIKYKKLMFFLRNNNIFLYDEEAKIIIDNYPDIMKMFDDVYEYIDEKFLNSINSFLALYDAYNCKILNELETKAKIGKNDYSFTRNINGTLEETIDPLLQYIRDISKYKISSEETKELLFKYKNGDESVKNKIIEGNLGLVIPVAKHYYKDKSTFLDFIQEGNIGLMKAVEKYDVEKKLRFSIYANYWIKRYIQNSITQNLGSITLPSRVNRLLLSIKNYENRFFIENGCYPTDNEISEKYKIDVEYLKMIRQVENIVPLDLCISDSNDLYKNNIDFDKCLYIKSFMEQLEDLLEKKFTPKQRDIIMYRYGLNGNEEHTFEEIANMFGESRQNIYGLEKTIRLKLSKELHAFRQ